MITKIKVTKKPQRVNTTTTTITVHQQEGKKKN